MFVEEYLQEVRRDHFHPAAIARYVSRLWLKAKKDVAANPEGARSFVFLGILYFGIAFAASVVIALTADLPFARLVLTFTGLWLIPVTILLLLHIDLLRDREGYPLATVNLATAITVFRIAMIPALAIAIVSGYWKTAFWMFIVGGLSDVLDGWVARRWKQETRLGQVLDPITDIYYHLGLFLSMGRAGLVDTPVVILAVVRFGGLLVGGITLYLLRGPIKIQSTLPGKLTGLVGSVLIGFLLLIPSYGAGSLGPVLAPLAQDGIVLLLAGSIVHAAIMGWFNFRHSHLASEQSKRVIRDVRFGDRSQ